MSFRIGLIIIIFTMATGYLRLHNSLNYCKFTAFNTRLSRILISWRFYDCSYADTFDCRNEDGEKCSTLDYFLESLEQSINDQTLLKLTLSEKTPSVNIDEIDTSCAFSGRLVKGKDENKKMQLISYTDSKMQSTSSTKIFSSTQEAIDAIELCLAMGFKRATISTIQHDFELKYGKKGPGKFRSTRKGNITIDVDKITNESLVGVNDPAILRRILEDRRLLLLSDPENQFYKVLYAEAKQRLK